jgi:hypothetical protein
MKAVVGILLFVLTLTVLCTAPHRMGTHNVSVFDMSMHYLGMQSMSSIAWA